MTVRVQSNDFDVGAELAALRGANPRVGAIAQFRRAGARRERRARGAGAHAGALPGMTERALEDIVAQARQRWDIIEALIVHRIG